MSGRNGARGRVTAEQPLHKLVGQLVHTLKMSHARGIINRDVRPSNVIVAGSETQQLVIIVWGFAVMCPEGSDSVTAVYEGTIVAYASDNVWRQYMDGSGRCGKVLVSPADDLVSPGLVHCIFVMLHPAVQHELRTLPRDDAQAARGFWHRVLATRPRWQLAVDAAARAEYISVRELLVLLEWLLE